MQQLTKSDRLMSFSSDDSIIVEQIQATHAPDGREVDVKYLVPVVEDILNCTSQSMDAVVIQATQARIEALEDKNHQASFIGILEALAFDLIDRIFWEITCKCSGGGDAHATAIAVLNIVPKFSWDTKLVLAMSAFAVIYGEFGLVAQNYTANQLAKSLAILKQLPEILENTKILKPWFDAIKSLTKAMLDVTKCIVEFMELPSQYITTDVSSLSTAIAQIPIAVYWTIRSMVACASQIASLTGLGHEHMPSTTEARGLSSLAYKVINMHKALETDLATCYKHIDKRKYIEAYEMLVRLFKLVHIDNMKVLKALISSKDDLLPLVDGATKKRVNIEVLRKKIVLLLISDIDISIEEISILEQMYESSGHHPTSTNRQYEVVWLPIMDPAAPWTEGKQKQFQRLQATMPWPTSHHPSLIDRAVIKFIKDVWHFGERPILVALDPHGRVSSPNALHMVWIWGNLAFPFTTTREEALWKEETWKLELLVDGIDSRILNWINRERFICLYGGEDIEWIQEFTKTAHEVAQTAGISLEMVYVGKSNPNERIRRNIVTVSVEKLSHYWPDLTSIWYFWARIESMWYSKMHLGTTVEMDPVMKEIMTMLSFDGNNGGWAILSKGSTEMTKAKGSTFLTCLLKYNEWKEHAHNIGFLQALRDQLEQLHTPHHCNRLVLPGIAGSIPERVVCSECGRAMEKSFMYKCCDE